jgi:hypothetical protein
MTRIEFLIKRATDQQEEAKRKYVEACEWLARNLTDAAGRAKAGDYVSETVMSSSLVLDISPHATEYRVLGETIGALQDVLDVEETSTTGEDR